MRSSGTESPIELSDIRNPIDSALKSIQFKTVSKRLWARLAGEIAQVVRLDKSSYGPQNSLELFFGTNINEIKDINIRNLDMVLRLERIAKHQNEVKSALDQESTNMPKEVRELIISSFILEEIGPIIKQTTSVSGLKALRLMFPGDNEFFVGIKSKPLVV